MSTKKTIKLLRDKASYHARRKEFCQVSGLLMAADYHMTAERVLLEFSEELARIREAKKAVKAMMGASKNG